MPTLKKDRRVRIRPDIPTDPTTCIDQVDGINDILEAFGYEEKDWIKRLSDLSWKEGVIIEVEAPMAPEEPTQYVVRLDRWPQAELTFAENELQAV